MYTKIVNVSMRDSDVLRVVLAGDFHWGSANCQEDLITDRFVPMYAGKPLTHVIDMGDEFDLIWRKDHKRFEPECVHERYSRSPNMIGEMRRDFLKVMNPLKGQIVAGCDSNHNASYRKHADFDLHAEFCEKMDAARLGYGGYVIFRIQTRGCKARSYDLVYAVCHGLGGGGYLPGGKVNTITRDGVNFQGHVIAHGHTHTLGLPASRKWFEWDPQETRLRVQRQRVFQTGSFLYTYSDTHVDGYGAWKRYQAADLGWIVTEATLDSLFGKGPRMKGYAEEF